MANIPSNAQTTRDALAVTTVLMAMFALSGSATAAFYVNCAGCHTFPQNGMAIVNFQTTTNLGNGLRKVFKVSPGQTAVIQLNVTNTYSGSYALNINNLDAGGVNNSSDHLAYAADPNWTSYFPGTATNFFMAGCATTSPHLWTFNLVVKTNTPADFYTVNSQMAGYYSSTMWPNRSRSTSRLWLRHRRCRFSKCHSGRAVRSPCRLPPPALSPITWITRPT
jgi:hypothetical protein